MSWTQMLFVKGQVRRGTWTPPLHGDVITTLPAVPPPTFRVTHTLLQRMIAPRKGDEDEPLTRWFSDRGGVH